MKNILMTVVVLSAGWATFTLMPAQELQPGTGVKGGKVGITKSGGTQGTLYVQAPPVTGAPYSALAITETTQTLADGNRIVQSQSQRVYRDSQGRERTEDAGTLSGVQAGVVISDPVTKTSYRLDPQTRTAVPSPAISFSPASPRTTLFVNGVEAVINNGIVREVSDSAKKETLPLQSIEGVFATGARSTVTIPAGEIGNQFPISLVDEAWYSPDLRVNVMTKHSDPRSGETVYRLTQIIRAEPDAQLFQVPADYTVQTGGGGRGRGPAPAAPASGAPPVPGAVKYGGNVMMAKLITQVAPQYTDQARNAKWQGTVLLNVTLDETGKPTDIAVAKSLGMGLDEQAMLAVWQWRFQPTLVNNVAVKVQTTIEVPFKLQ
jgi:TonB family protein